MRKLLCSTLAALVVTAGAAFAQGAGQAVATFGSGCFWCTESDFDKVPGVISTVSGYMGGKSQKPSYEEVSTGRSGHVEVVQVTYDPAKVTYQVLLEKYWHTTDPFDGSGQFCDKGTQYRPVIFTHSPEQHKAAEASKDAAAKELAAKFKLPIAVKIEQAAQFWPAEEYHQDFYKKNPAHYNRYRLGCGRDFRLEQIWGKLAPKS